MFEVSHLFFCFLDNYHILSTFLVIWPIQVFQFRLYYIFHSWVFWGLGDLANRIVPVRIVLHILLLGISRSCSIPSVTFGLLTIPGGSIVDSPADYHPCTKWFLLQTGVVLTLYHNVTAEQCHASWQHQVLAGRQNLCVGWKPEKGMLLKLLLSINLSKLLSNDFQSH